MSLRWGLVAIHVDDFLSVASSKEANEEFKRQLESEWTIAESDTDFCLGIEIERDHNNCHIYVSQTAMIDRIVAEFGQTDRHIPCLNAHGGECKFFPDLTCH